MTIDREALGRALRAARQNHGLSQEAVAKRTGLSRTVLAQSELGNRPVSVDELSKLAALYERPIADFSLEAPPDRDELSAMLLKYGAAIPSRLQPRLDGVLSLCAEAVALEELLGRSSSSAPPHYELPYPRNTADAIMQGQHVASQERQRLGFGAEAPVDSVSELLASQGARVALLQLPDDEVSGIYLRHHSVGLLFIAGCDDIDSERFGLLHGYALELLDWKRAFIVTTPASSDELIHVRATAFSVAFLLPQAGIEAAVAALDKGRPSRRSLAVFGYAAEELLEDEVRSAPGSQALSCHDVAAIARRFGVTYRAAVYRLLALDVISKAETKELLKPERRRAASTYVELFRPTAEHGRPIAMNETIELKRQVVHLAIEAYRRRLTSKADLAGVASKLQLPGLTSAKLLEIADAAR